MAHTPKTVVFVLGLGHTGGTLLGNVLDVHPEVLHVGEIPAPLAKGHAFRCYWCGESPCPIWGGVVSEQFVRRCYTDFLRWRERRRWTLIVPYMRTVRLSYRPGAIYEHLFSGLPEVRVIVDKSLDLGWIRWNSASAEFQSRYLLLVRDLRGVVASRLRKYPEKSAREWARVQGKALQEVLSFYDGLPPGAKETVRYEDLVLRPEETMTRLCWFLNIPYTPDFLEYWRFPHHIIGGNRNVFFQSLQSEGRKADHLLDDLREADIQYYQSRPGFRLDLRWQAELSEDDLKAIDAEVGPLQERFGYA